MRINQYSQWRESQITLHMILQMMGKTKLNKAPPQPEWGHSLLYMTARGFSTGLLPGDGFNFDVSIDLLEGTVEARCSSGRKAGFRLRDQSSVADYYKDYLSMLHYIGHEMRINPVPQEFFFKTPFDDQAEKVDFDKIRMRDYFESCVLVYNGLTRFASGYRGKKCYPCFSGAPST